MFRNIQEITICNETYIYVEDQILIIEYGEAQEELQTNMNDKY